MKIRITDWAGFIGSSLALSIETPLRNTRSKNSVPSAVNEPSRKRVLATKVFAQEYGGGAPERK